MLWCGSSTEHEVVYYLLRGDYNEIKIHSTSLKVTNEITRQS